MLTTLSVPFADTSAGALSWWLGDAPDALGAVRLSAAGAELELRVLGASHQAVARVGGIEVPEVVACRAGEQQPLPDAAARQLDGAAYRFTSLTHHLAADDLAAAAERLRHAWSHDDGALVAAFPGSPHALTVVAGRPVPSGWRWRTWHVYPSSGEVVTTRGQLVRT